jgi:hypothetical protein
MTYQQNLRSANKNKTIFTINKLWDETWYSWIILIEQQKTIIFFLLFKKIKPQKPQDILESTIYTLEFLK